MWMEHTHKPWKKPVEREELELQETDIRVTSHSDQENRSRDESPQRQWATLPLTQGKEEGSARMCTMFYEYSY